MSHPVCLSEVEQMHAVEGQGGGLVSASRPASGTAHSCAVLRRHRHREEAALPLAARKAGWVAAWDQSLVANLPRLVGLSGEPGAWHTLPKCQPGPRAAGQLSKSDVRIPWVSGALCTGTGTPRAPQPLLLRRAGHGTRQLTEGPSAKATLLSGEIRGCATA